MERDELAAWLRLSLTPGVGNSTARQLLASFGLPEAIFQQSASALRACVSERQASALLTSPPAWEDAVRTTWEWLQAAPEQRRVLTLGDSAYPGALLNMEDPPLLLYAMGGSAAWARCAQADFSRHCLAIVGSRNPTPQGTSNARLFAKTLAQGGLTIVSGMALGVDGAAHEGALEGAAPDQVATIAVVGTGLDRVYPRQHRDLAHRVALHGLLLSEYHLGTPPLSANFPKRNRIIAGLSRGTLVVEAALQSGSLITARLAAEMGTDVFAIPGSIHSTQSRGCHALIKQGAKLVESAQDILEDFNVFSSSPADSEIAIDSVAACAVSTRPEAPFAPQTELLEAMGFEPCGLDTLLARTGLDTATLQAQLMQLELSGHVGRLPGGMFQRTAKA